MIPYVALVIIRPGVLPRPGDPGFSWLYILPGIIGFVIAVAGGFLDNYIQEGKDVPKAVVATLAGWGIVALVIIVRLILSRR